jgi:hypothetical protein
MPARRLMLIRELRPDENRRARPAWLQCQRMRSAEAPHWWWKYIAVAAAAGVRVNPANAEPSARDAVAMATPGRGQWRGKKTAGPYGCQRRGRERGETRRVGMSRERRVTRNLNQTRDTCESRRLESDRTARARVVRRPPSKTTASSASSCDSLASASSCQRRVGHASPRHSPPRPP